MSAKLYRYEVHHEIFGTVIVNGISEATAIQAAIRHWGLDWREYASWCSARKLGAADKPRCRRCHKEFGEPGDITAFCPACERAMEQYHREKRRFAPARRRPGYED